MEVLQSPGGIEMKRTIPEQNYEILLDSAVSRLREVVNNWKKLHTDFISSIGVSDDGSFYFLKGTEDFDEKNREFELEINRLSVEIKEIKSKIGKGNKENG